MSGLEEFPSNLVPIKDVNDKQVQRAGRFAVDRHNKNVGHHFSYKGVVNGVYNPIIGGDLKYFIIVIEAINDDGFRWSYIAKVVWFPFMPREFYKLLSFEEVIEFPVPK